MFSHLGYNPSTEDHAYLCGIPPETLDYFACMFGNPNGTRLSIVLQCTGENRACSWNTEARRLGLSYYRYASEDAEDEEDTEDEEEIVDTDELQKRIMRLNFARMGETQAEIGMEVEEEPRMINMNCREMHEFLPTIDSFVEDSEFLQVVESGCNDEDSGTEITDEEKSKLHILSLDEFSELLSGFRLNTDVAEAGDHERLQNCILCLNLLRFEQNNIWE